MPVSSFRFEGLETIEKDMGGSLITVVRFSIGSTTELQDRFNGITAKIIIPYDPTMTLLQIQESCFRELPGLLEGIAAEMRPLSYEAARNGFAEFSTVPIEPFGADAQ